MPSSTDVNNDGVHGSPRDQGEREHHARLRQPRPEQPVPGPAGRDLHRGRGRRRDPQLRPRREGPRWPTSTWTGCWTWSWSTWASRSGCGATPARGPRRPLLRWAAGPRSGCGRTGGNRDAIGAKVDVRIGDCVVRRELVVGGGHGGGQLGLDAPGPGAGGSGGDPGDLARRRGRSMDRCRRQAGSSSWSGERRPPGRGTLPGRPGDADDAPLASRPSTCPTSAMPGDPSGGARRDATQRRVDAAPGARRSTRLRPARGVRGPRAQRQPRVPDRVRPAVRGGAARRSVPDDPPAMLVGNECWGTAGAAPLPMRRHLFQDFSLPSQPRDRSRPLGEILAGEGIGRGEPRRRPRLEAVRGPLAARGSGVHRRRAPGARRAGRASSRTPTT